MSIEPEDWESCKIELEIWLDLKIEVESKGYNQPNLQVRPRSQEADRLQQQLAVLPVVADTLWD